jgi:mitochondrial enoyl-[acyl-carrier protein] reductase / trans-2-enoyl-CoA reductase
MMSVNPLSAWAMLEEFVDLQAGDWVVQNAANSAVGRSAIQIAKARGWRTLNVVRRPELVDELKSQGADVVVLEEVDLRAEVENLCGTLRPRLALNAVGGASALNLANALGDGGTLVTYGAMGRQPLKLPNGLLIFRDLAFRGFWLKKWSAQLSSARRAEVMAGLVKLSLSGQLKMPVHRVFPLTELVDAIAEANQEGRSGKVLLDLLAQG